MQNGRHSTCVHRVMVRTLSFNQEGSLVSSVLDSVEMRASGFRSWADMDIPGRTHSAMPPELSGTFDMAFLGRFLKLEATLSLLCNLYIAPLSLCCGDVGTTFSGTSGSEPERGPAIQHTLAPSRNGSFAMMLEDFQRQERASRRKQDTVLLLMHAAISLAGPLAALAIAVRLKRAHT